MSTKIDLQDLRRRMDGAVDAPGALAATKDQQNGFGRIQIKEAAGIIFCWSLQ